METQQFPQDELKPSDTNQPNQGDPIAPQQDDAQASADEPSSETPPNANSEPGGESDGVVMIPLNQIFIDAPIFPRASLDEFTIQQYAAALIRGEQLPPITVEATGQGEYRILKGVHRFQAYCLRQSIYTGKESPDLCDEPLPSLSDDELNTIPCVIETMPPDMHPMVFCMMDNLKHGKPLTPEDYKRVARQLYKDNEGAAISGLAKLIRIDRRTFQAYVADLKEAFEAKKEAIIRDRHAQGASNKEIVDELKKQFHSAKGNGKSQVSENVSKIAKETQSVEEEAGPETGDADPPPAPPVDTVQDRQDPPEEEHKEQESEPVEPETQPEAPAPIELKVVAGTNTITIHGVHSLPDHLQDRLRKAVDELIEQIRTEAEKDEEQEPDSSETPSPDTAEHDSDMDEDHKEKDPPPAPVDEIRKFVPAIQPSRGSRPVSYPV